MPTFQEDARCITSATLPGMDDKAFYERPEFLELRDEWYEKLKEDGFHDIEVIDKLTNQPGSLMLGVSPGDLGRSPRRAQWRDSCEDYYRLASQYAWTLPRGPERHIVEMHASGLSDRKCTEAALKTYPELATKDVMRAITRCRRVVRKEARHGQG